MNSDTMRQRIHGPSTRHLFSHLTTLRNAKRSIQLPTSSNHILRHNLENTSQAMLQSIYSSFPAVLFWEPGLVALLVSERPPPCRLSMSRMASCACLAPPRAAPAGCKTLPFDKWEKMLHVVPHCVSSLHETAHSHRSQRKQPLKPCHLWTGTSKTSVALV